MESVMSVKKRDSEYAIDVKDVTKVYRLYEKPIDRLKESMSISHKNYHRDFYALNQLSFQVKKGETVGIRQVHYSENYHRRAYPHCRRSTGKRQGICPAGAWGRL